MKDPQTLGGLPAFYLQTGDALTGFESLAYNSFHASLNGLALLDTDCCMLAANAAFTDLLGRAPEKLLGIPLPELVHPDELLLCMHQMSRLLEDQLLRYETELRFLHADGTPLSVRISASVLPDGAARYIRLEAQNIDGWKKAAAALRDQSALIPHLLDFVPSPYLVLDRGWKLIQLNKAAEGLFERSREELTGRDFWTLLPSLLHTPLHQACLQAAEEQHPVIIEEELTPARMRFRISCSPCKPGLAVFFRDITE
ncbi:PAS domain-containing protein [Paenibacillus filicis]|uniref:PAS domain-containing protein n=1 Tax=Paenibacillus gyeongsangnamensis TaxID=3388067 RepID=A0ABT4QFN9_9BACL|nr:PAS domain-containing protein [Paenibacillus filicis]MCZ8515697.1 PAS domain-containing protein [Paenibacillus filicis]